MTENSNYWKKYYAANRDRKKAAAREWYSKNKERTKARNKTYIARDPDKWRKYSREYRREWVKSHPQTESQKVSARIRASKWQKQNRERRREIALRWIREHPAEALANCRRYQTKKMKAMPSWADRDAIKAIYRQAREMTKRDGIKYHVDHIIPLRGKGVCGLHVPWNLQIIPADQNIKKGNRVAA